MIIILRGNYIFLIQILKRYNYEINFQIIQSKLYFNFTRCEFKHTINFQINRIQIQIYIYIYIYIT